MKILLTHGYVIAEDPKEQTIMKPYPPLGILGIAAWLRREGYRPEIFDSTFRTREELKRRLLELRPDVLGIYTNLMTRPHVVELTRFVRSQPELNHTLIVLGGPEVTQHAERFLERGADLIVIGEGEETMLDVVRQYESMTERESIAGRGALFSSIPGLAWRNESGDVGRSQPRTHLRSIDDLPVPARDLIDLNAYLTIWRDRHGRNAISVSTMRGCPYTCRWCSKAVYGNSYRRRSPEVVVSEMLHLKETYNPDTLWFVDDVFTISPKWMRGFAEEVITRDGLIPYECISRADRLDEEMIDLLVKSGCYRVWIGAESGSQRIIDAMDRRVEIGRVRDMMLLSRAKGLETGTFIMLGYPGETEQDILETIEHLKQCRPDHFTVTTTYPITGTELFTEVQEQLVNVPEWESSTDRDLRFPTTYLRPYYQFALRRLYSEVALDRLGREPNGSLLRLLKEHARRLSGQLGMWWWRKKSGEAASAP